MSNYLLPEDDGLLMRPCGSWTEVKLDYLARYILAFETAMREKWGIRNYIDLLAGPGKNKIRGTKRILLGSPLLALTTSYPFTGYYFSDIDKATIDALALRTKVSNLYNRVSIQIGDCNLVVDRIVEKLKGYTRTSLNLAFLDPQGMELDWTTIAKLASLGRMDLIIYYPQLGLNLNMKKMYKSPKETAIDRFFGGLEWREIYNSRQNKPYLHRYLIDYYKFKLFELGYTEVFQGDENVGDEPLIINQLKNAKLYRLIFASKHKLGHTLWRGVVRRDVSGQRKLAGF